MYSFLLPNIVIPILTYKIIIYNNNNENFISNSLHHYLNKVKGKIELYKKSWDNFKKITNNYEYIHTNIPHINKPVCNYIPLSRSFFKMIELLNELNIIHELPKSNLNSFHLAEGPGGFIEALSYLRNNISDNYHGMTLIDDNNRNIPGWKKSYSYLNKNTNINIEYGMDGTGNIMNPDNLLYCYNKFKNTMDLVTADGGFDFSINFNKQEIMCTKLIYAEIANAIAIQKKGGTFILKIFDIFSKGTVDAIFLLCGLYDSVYITKPKTSRTANSEKYIVCKGFRNINTKYFVDIFHNILKDINKYENICILNIEFPYIFINKLEDINAILGQIQIENIINTIQLIEYNNNEKIYNIKKQNIQRCLNWCMKYNLSCNSNINKEENIFKKKLNINI